VNSQQSNIAILRATLSLFTVFLFVSIIYSLAEPKDSVCFQIKYENICMSQISILTPHENRCHWNGRFCDIRSPLDGIVGVIVVALIASAISAPINESIGLLLHDAVFKVTRNECMASKDQDIFHNLWHWVDSFYKESRVLSQLKKKTNTHVYNFSLALFKHRLRLRTEVDIKRFNKCWNLENSDDVEFKVDGLYTSKNILSNMQNVNKRLWRYLDSDGVSGKESYDVDKELCCMFIEDLLPDKFSVIFREKIDKEFPPFKTVSRYTRLFSLFGILLYSIGGIVYLYYFAFHRKETVEKLWFWSCMFWFALDFLVLAPLNIMISDIALPMIAQGHIDEARNIFSTVTSAEYTNTYHVACEYFNSLEYMLASVRVALTTCNRTDISRRLSKLKSVYPMSVYFHSIYGSLHRQYMSLEDGFLFILNDIPAFYRIMSIDYSVIMVTYSLLWVERYPFVVLFPVLLLSYIAYKMLKNGKNRGVVPVDDPPNLSVVRSDTTLSIKPPVGIINEIIADNSPEDQAEFEERWREPLDVPDFDLWVDEPFDPDGISYAFSDGDRPATSGRPSTKGTTYSRARTAESTSRSKQTVLPPGSRLAEIIDPSISLSVRYTMDLIDDILADDVTDREQKRPSTTGFLSRRSRVGSSGLNATEVNEKIRHFIAHEAANDSEEKYNDASFSVYDKSSEIDEGEVEYDDYEHDRHSDGDEEVDDDDEESEYDSVKYGGENYDDHQEEEGEFVRVNDEDVKEDYEDNYLSEVIDNDINFSPINSDDDNDEES